MNYNNKLSELLQNVKSWSELKAKLEEFNTSQTETTTKTTIAGKLFEHFAKYYFTVNPEHAQLYSKVWLYEEIPTEIKTKLNFPDRDFGIDLLLQDNLERFTAVQCKFKNDEDATLTWKRDSIAHPFALADKCEAVMIFTNAAGCVSEIEKREKFNQIAIGQLIDTSAEVLQGIKFFIDNNALKPFEKFARLPHQVIAVNKTIEYFNKPNPRAQLILPCGAGKTLAALWVKEDLQSKNTLVLFPSLALLRQFKTEWANQREQEYIYINVCSEKDIDVGAEDSTVTHTYEISGEVTTSPDRISEFLSSATNKIVFSTYQSIKAIETALQFLPDFSFDLIICDEAHRTAGAKSNTFAIVHDQDRIRGTKRLYMTATPKIVSNKLKARLGDDYELLCDMSNPEIFGDEAHHMSFGEAIQLNILVDYKIIGIGVTHKQVKEFIEKRRYVTQKYDMKEIADNYALDIVMEKYSAFHAITFHSRVKTADEFAQRHNAFFSPDVYARHVSGEHTTSKRAKVLTEFKLHKKGVVSNARCLTEGVDVPIIDLIYFCDPKNSKIDIVQASGRALRKDRHGIKPIGYIVVPIYHHIDEDIEKEIEKKPYFQNLIQVIRSLCDQDERLRAEIDDVAFEKGEKKSKRIEITYDNSELENIIKLDGLDKKIREFLFEQIIEKTRNYWNVKFLQLKAYIEKFGHSTISKGDEEHRDLYFWVGNIRKSYHEGNLAKEKKKKLNDIGFDWKGEQRLTYLPPDEKWQKNYKKIGKYFEEHGDIDIPARYEKDKPLATWLVNQRVKYDEARLTKEQIQLLELLDINWDPKNIFGEFVEQLKAFKKQHGHVKVPQGGELAKLGRRVQRMRQIHNNGTRQENGSIIYEAYGTLTAEKIKILNDLGFAWDLSNASWDSRFQELKEFYNKNGYSHLKLSEDQSIFFWCYKQRRNQDKLEDWQIEKLKSIDFVFDVSQFEKPDDFLDRMIELQKFYDENNHFRVPNKEVKLKAWLASIRRDYRASKLDTTKIELLNSIGFKENDFYSEDKNWETKFAEFQEHYKKYNTFFIPKHLPEFRPLSSWIKHQQKKLLNGKLPDFIIEKFDSIGFSLTKKYESNELLLNQNLHKQFQKSIDEVEKFYKEFKTFQIPPADKQRRRLRIWLLRIVREFNNKTLDSSKEKALRKIGFDFKLERTVAEKFNNARSERVWKERIEELKKYHAQHDSYFFPTNDKDNSGLRLWLNYIKQLVRKRELSQDKIDELLQMDFDFNARAKRVFPLDPRWIEMFNECKKHRETTGTFLKTDEKLTIWIRTQRSTYNAGKLSKEKQDLLKKIGFSFSTISKRVENKVHHENWEKHFEWLKKYYDTHQTFFIPKSDKEHEKLLSWLTTQRAFFKKEQLLKERENKLLSIGFDFEKNIEAISTNQNLKNKKEEGKKI